MIELRIIKENPVNCVPNLNELDIIKNIIIATLIIKDTRKHYISCLVNDLSREDFVFYGSTIDDNKSGYWYGRSNTILGVVSNIWKNFLSYTPKVYIIESQQELWKLISEQHVTNEQWIDFVTNLKGDE